MSFGVWNTYQGQPWEQTQYSVRPVPYVPANSWLNQNVSPNPWAGGTLAASGPVGGSAPGFYGSPTYGMPGGKTLTSGPGGVLPMPGSIPTQGPTFAGTTTYPVGAGPNQQVNDAITGLLTPGLVPDIARQSAEISAGRGIGGSPAGGSTAVRMSEADWLTRLGLANTLLSGEASRNLPYQITPLQQEEIRLRQQELNQRLLGSFRGGFGGGGGGYGGGYNPAAYGGGGMGGYSSPSGRGNFGSGPFGSDLLGSSSGQRPPTNLDEVYDWLGFGNMGSQPGDWTNPPMNEGEFGDFIGMEPPDFSYDMWD